MISTPRMVRVVVILIVIDICISTQWLSCLFIKQPFLPPWLPWMEWRQDDLPSVFKKSNLPDSLLWRCLMGPLPQSAFLSLLLQSEWSLLPLALHPKQPSPLCNLHSPSSGLSCRCNLFVISVNSPRCNWNCSLFTEQTRGENDIVCGELWCRMVKCHRFLRRLMVNVHRGHL